LGYFNVIFLPEKEIKALEATIKEQQQILGSTTQTNIDEQMRAKIRVHEDRLNNVMYKAWWKSECLIIFRHLANIVKL
jgi:hypothetical protein